MFRLDVLGSRELQAALLAIRRAPSELQKQFRQHARAMVEPEWQKAVTEQASTRLQQRVLAQTAKASVSSQNVRLSSAGSASKLSGGLQPSKNGHAVEFGANANRQVTQRSRKGKQYTRRMGDAFGAPRRAGHAVFPAARSIIPRIASLFVQTVVRTLHDAFEGK